MKVSFLISTKIHQIILSSSITKKKKSPHESVPSISSQELQTKIPFKREKYNKNDDEFNPLHREYFDKKMRETPVNQTPKKKGVNQSNRFLHKSSEY